MKATVTDINDKPVKFVVNRYMDYLAPVISDSGALHVNRGNYNAYTEVTLMVFAPGQWKTYEVDNSGGS